ncbi:hypothetical protein ACFYWX_31260 [Streptomyces sp. NPDC002888]|uniref:hypothetical protein n=1 Tax=Streptomyces sp. NPDC002888 TaxID=3364668 RepID=UPI00367524CA
MRTEFFSWFHLEEVDRQVRADDSGIVRFRPGNPEFRPQVLCEMDCGTGGALTRVTVAISSTFIDDPRTWAFARDLANSFLTDGLVFQSDVDTVADVLRDLKHRPHSGVQRVPVKGVSEDALFDSLTDAMSRGETPVAFMGSPAEQPPELPSVVSRGFAVYSGDRPSFRRDLTLTRFTMENVTVDGGRVLRMSLERRTR